MSIADTVKHSASMKLALTGFMTFIWLAAHVIAGERTANSILSVDSNSQEFAGRKLADSRTLQLFTVDLFNYFAIACSLAVTAVTRISFLVKTIIIMFVILLQVIMNFTLLSDVLSLRWQSYHQLAAPSSSSSTTTTTTTTTTTESYHKQFDQYILTLTLITICWALFLINRQFEKTNRHLFLWRKQVEQRKEKVADMRQKNEALVYNILPPNVAKIFLGKRTIQDEELYSKSYEAVGVLFAAMPNFSDFYTEESVNNQGLECLRFLNEVISDYDALLDQDRFKNIIKIKTMGSTYMAASGLYEGDALEEKQRLKEEEEDGKGRDTINSRAEGRGAELMARTGNGSDGLAAAASNGQNSQDRENSNGNSNNNLTSSSSHHEQERLAAEAETSQVRAKWGHLEQLTEFALALKDTLNNINKESFNNFVLRIGKAKIGGDILPMERGIYRRVGRKLDRISRLRLAYI